MEPTTRAGQAKNPVMPVTTVRVGIQMIMRMMIRISPTERTLHLAGSRPAQSVTETIIRAVKAVCPAIPVMPVDRAVIPMDGRTPRRIITMELK